MKPGRKTSVTIDRLRIDASRSISRMVGHYVRINARLALRKDPTATTIGVRNAARIAALRKALDLVRGN